MQPELYKVSPATFELATFGFGECTGLQVTFITFPQVVVLQAFKFSPILHHASTKCSLLEIISGGISGGNSSMQFRPSRAFSDHAPTHRSGLPILSPTVRLPSRPVLLVLLVARRMGPERMPNDTRPRSEATLRPEGSRSPSRPSFWPRRRPGRINIDLAADANHGDNTRPSVASGDARWRKPRSPRACLSMILTVQRDNGVHGMRFMIKGVLTGLVVGIAGCSSHDSKQVTNSEKPAASRAGANTASGNAGLAPAVNAGAVNQVADQAKGVINTATATADKVIGTAAVAANTATNGLNRTAATMRSDVQQATYDAASLTND